MPRVPASAPNYPSYQKAFKTFSLQLRLAQGVIISVTADHAE